MRRPSKRLYAAIFAFLAATATPIFVTSNCDAQQPGADAVKVVQPNPPAEFISGSITRIDAKAGLVEINLGNKDGLKTDHTLEAYRLEPRPEYLGLLRIVQVQEQTALGKLMRPLPGRDLKTGDLVVSRLAAPAKKDAARNDDPLQAQRERVLIEEQKLTQTVEENLGKARRLQRDFPEKSAQLLRSTLLQLWDHPDVNERLRHTLLTRVLAARRDLAKQE